jgi:hypothetical protein
MLERTKLALYARLYEVPTEFRTARAAGEAEVQADEFRSLGSTQTWLKAGLGSRTSQRSYSYSAHMESACEGSRPQPCAGSSPPCCRQVGSRFNFSQNHPLPPPLIAGPRRAI